MKRSGLIWLAMMSLLIPLTAGCRRQAAGPAAAPLRPPIQTDDYQFAQETGFSVDLGQKPQFAPQVAAYQVAPDLGNVANLVLFKSDLRPEHRKLIAKNGFVVVPAEWKQMEFVYELNNYPRVHRPSFVTADSILHTFHIFYDYVLRTIEVSTLYDRASTLALGLLRGAAARYDQAAQPEIKEAALCNFAYALVPVRLLEIPKEQWQVEVSAQVAKLADQELALIGAHEGFAASPTVGFKVDYSQFIPRGHYTRSDKLKRYFKALMWYGLVPIALRNMRDQLAPRQARQAVLMAQAVVRDKVGQEPLGKVWEDVYEPTAFMVGFADDNTPGDFGQATRKLFGEPLDTKNLVPEENLTKLAEEVLAMRPPGIAMASILKDPELPGIPQFRTLGQRFVLDSHIFQMMVYPDVGVGAGEAAGPGTHGIRTFPMGLDVMSVLGSERAYQIADKVYEQAKFRNYTEQTQKLRQEVAGYTDKDWTKNVYVGWLHALKSLLEVKQEGYPSFMRSQAWVDKQLNASLGSWAELRHDTILYAKQSVVAECGGEGGQQKPPPPPKGYVEPEVLTYWRMGLLARQLRDGLQQRKLLTDQDVLESFDELISLLEFLQSVSIKELTGKTLTAEEYSHIEYYGDTLARLNLYTRQGVQGDEITSMTDKDMAVIADVHTGLIGRDPYALEEGVGHANEVYVVYPLEGKLLLGRGAVFDYHEFTVPVAERMTDEAWQQNLASRKAPGPPKWTASFRSPLKGTGESVKFQDIPEFTGGGC